MLYFMEDEAILLAISYDDYVFIIPVSGDHQLFPGWDVNILQLSI